jgi:hypothetical protein
MPAPITERIGSVFAECIKDLALTGNVLTRKRPVFQDGERPPLICVCVSDREEFECLGSSGERGKLLWLVTRPVTIAIAFASGGKTGDNTELRRYRDAIWSVGALKLQAKGLAEANDVKPAGKAIFDPAAFVSSTVDWSMVELVVETLEVRDAA